MKLFIVFNMSWMIAAGFMVSAVRTAEYNKQFAKPASNASLVMECYRIHNDYNYCYDEVVN